MKWDKVGALMYASNAGCDPDAYRDRGATMISFRSTEAVQPAVLVEAAAPESVAETLRIQRRYDHGSYYHRLIYR